MCHRGRFAPWSVIQISSRGHELRIPRHPGAGRRILRRRCDTLDRRKKVHQGRKICNRCLLGKRVMTSCRKIMPKQVERKRPILNTIFWVAVTQKLQSMAKTCAPRNHSSSLKILILRSYAVSTQGGQCLGSASKEDLSYSLEKPLINLTNLTHARNKLLYHQAPPQYPDQHDN